jgi:hypothetical protein
VSADRRLERLDDERDPGERRAPLALRRDSVPEGEELPDQDVLTHTQYLQAIDRLN